MNKTRGTHVVDALTLYDQSRKASAQDEFLRIALDTLDAAVRLYTPSRIAVAFNGGKDATVVLHLTRAAVANWCRSRSEEHRVQCLYLVPESGEEFEEVEQFVKDQVKAFGLSVVEIEGGFKRGVETFVKGRDLCAFVMGTRCHDPHAHTLEHFTPSSPGWSPFMRVNPILTWDYHAVWKFLRAFELPYCLLYDNGYTSIGGKNNTLPNPALCLTCNEHVSYAPAWTLSDPSLERAGRVPPGANNSDTQGKVDGPEPLRAVSPKRH